MSKYESERGGSRALDLILSLALIAGAGFGCWYVYSHGVKIDQTTTYYTAEAEIEEPTEETPGQQFDSVEVANSMVNAGDLVLVNNDIPCVVDESVLVSLYNKKLEAESQSFSVRDAELLVTEPFADALIAMLDDFYAETGDDNILILSGYRTEELQKQLYEEDLAETGLDYSDRVSRPGHSEHQTGLGVDFSLYGGEYDGTGIYSWIDEHCADYGIIKRYPESKSEITGMRAESWHYRYVGRPHSTYITQNDLCLEEYINLIETAYPCEGEHLRVTDSDGKVYEIYYYAMDHDYDSTMVAVPAGTSYTICGTNSDGFIVTADTGEMGVPGEAMEVPGGAPAEDMPAEDVPAEDVPAEEAPAEEAPAPEEGVPAEEAPAEDAPAV